MPVNFHRYYRRYYLCRHRHRYFRHRVNIFGAIIQCPRVLKNSNVASIINERHFLLNMYFASTSNLQKILFSAILRHRRLSMSPDSVNGVRMNSCF